MKIAIFLITFYSSLSFAETNANILYNNYEKSVTENYNSYEIKILKKWHEVATSTNKVFVKYYNRENIRLVVDYESGNIKIESLTNNPEEVKQILEKVIADKEDNNAIINFKDLVIDEFKSKKEYIGDLIKSADFDEKLKRTKISLNFVKDHIQKRAERIRPIVLEWTKKAEVDYALTMAMIRQESAFNPKAESKIPAYGLMQIVPKYAGRDVNISIINVVNFS